MADRPIIFSAPMVRALLDGRKTQTRRFLKPQPPEWCERAGFTMFTPKGQVSFRGTYQDQGPAEKFIPLRFWNRDRLYVRENWRPVGDGPLSECTGPEDIRFAASVSEEELACFKWRPSIHMPRWASRLTLIVTSVKVERLQDISPKDAEAEGVFRHVAEHSVDKVFRSDREATAIQYFRNLWNSINGADAWDKNPWVVALTFTVRHSNIDQLKEAA